MFAGPAPGKAPPVSENEMNPFIASSKLDTQASRVYRMLEAQIVQGELLPGQELSERSISAQFRIGRTPVREALQKLAANHMVQVEPRRGTFVSRIDGDIASELFLVVWPLEKLLIRRAIGHASEEEFKQLGELAARLASGHADDNRTSLYEEINDQIMRMARNPYLLAVLAPMRLLVERIRFFHGLASDPELTECFANLAARISLQDTAGSMTAFAAYKDRFEAKAMTELARSSRRDETAPPSLQRRAVRRPPETEDVGSEDGNIALHHEKNGHRSTPN